MARPSGLGDVRTVLVVGDELSREVEGALAHDTHLVIVTASGEAAVEAALARAPAVHVILSGLELASRVCPSHPDVPVLIVTAPGDVDDPLAAIRAGAYDFVPRPFDPRDLVLRVRRAAEWRALTHEVRMLRGALPPASDGLLGRSPAMDEVRATLDRVVPSRAPLWIVGEPGTGKELVARALHARGRRPNAPFVAVDCAADPALLDDAIAEHLVRARGGTLFLDEIAEMPLRLQSKLLRALEQRGDQQTGSEARVVSATHRDVEARVAEGLFREDLFYRLDVVDVRVPPLRARGSDVLLLAQHFVERFAEQASKRVTGMDAACARHLLDYGWPGNVRELSIVIERAVALARGTEITTADLPEKVRHAASVTPRVLGASPSEMITLEELERRYILDVLDACRGHRGRAAEVLGVDRKTLYARLKQYGAPGER